MAEGGGAEAEAKKKEEPEKKPEEEKKEARERVYYADWIRALAIMLVIFVHCLVNSFDASGLEPEEVPQI